MSKQNSTEASPTRAKIILTIFGLGPILLIGIFLGLNGFFAPIK